jgi:hypothetical protein
MQSQFNVPFLLLQKSYYVFCSLSPFLQVSDLNDLIVAVSTHHIGFALLMLLSAIRLLLEVVGFIAAI